jgi:hypothetical protein
MGLPDPRRFAAVGPMLALCAALASPAQAQAPQPELRQPANRLDAISSCYATLGRERPAAAPGKALFVLIDQTTLFDASLQGGVVEALRANLRPAQSFSIGTFSAYLGDRYTDLLLAGQLDAPLAPAERDDTGKAKLKAFDQCMQAQQRYARDLTGRTLRSAFGKASVKIARSDIFTSLHDFAQHAVRTSKARARVLLIASDMMEHSGISSFYASQKLRLIDPEVELQKLRTRKLVPDLAGVRVFVIGAGLLPGSGAGSDPAASYRDPARMQALERFWTMYFREARAELVEFGKPQLLQPVD